MATPEFPLDQRMTQEETARYLGKSIFTLRRWRNEGKGPKYVRLGRAHSNTVFYTLSDLDDFIRQHTVASSDHA